jgi:hypothetical protein
MIKKPTRAVATIVCRVRALCRNILPMRENHAGLATPSVVRTWIKASSEKKRI